ncbi:mannonate dehydratase, partial [Chelativorans sp.]|uniref:mannonate dehydratase n=1 Tax=Chelativorans sp. TaxID=2203393 RepID=UPI0028118DF9
RTDLAVRLPGGGTALRLNMHELAAFDCHILQREGAERDYTAPVLARAAEWNDRASEDDKRKLLANMMAGLPGAFKRYEIEELRAAIAEQSMITHEQLRNNLVQFLENVLPAAEEAGVSMCIHPDDPPRDVTGLCRIVKNAEDIAFVLDAVPSDYSGLTLCTGSLGANSENDVPEIARHFSHKIKFAHLRNVKKDADGSFMESDHLGGDVDLVAVIARLLEEEQSRLAGGGAPIPFRADHGHELIDDSLRATHPGYPVVGRLRGLAELRGVITALTHQRGYAGLT